MDRNKQESPDRNKGNRPLEPQTWFTADLHLGHENIMRYCRRPFSSISEHDEVIITNINTRVHQEDHLYILGDFSFRGQPGIISEYRSKINCRKICLIMGNHDPHTHQGFPKPILTKNFYAIRDLLKIKIYSFGIKQDLVLCHYAMRTWDKSHYGSYHCYGHSHYTLPDDPNSLSIDVGIDAVAGRATGKTHEELANENAWDFLDPEQYKPLSLNDIESIMKAKDLRI